MMSIKKLGFAILLSAVVFSSCGKGLNEIREEEEKTTLSPAEQVNLGKHLLEIGKFSDARELFSSALRGLSDTECVDSEREFKTCPYCDAVYGKAIADLLGTLQLISQLMEALGRETQSAPRVHYMQKATQTDEIDKLLSGTLEEIIGLLLGKIDSLRKNLREVMEKNCETQVNATAVVNLLGREIVIPGKPKEEINEKAEIIYSPYFANLVNSLLSLAAGILDIAYSQNWQISVTSIRDFVRELISQDGGRSPLEVIAGVGDLFAKNPRLWTKNEQRENLWSKSATDLAEALEGIGKFAKSLPVICSIRGEEAIQKFISSFKLGNFSGELICSLTPNLAPYLDKLASLLTKWAKSLKGELLCEVKDEEGLRSISARRDDGCIRIFEDLEEALKGTPIEGLLKQLGMTAIFAFSPSEFFKARDLRAFLPLVRKIEGKEKYVFNFEFEKEENREDKKHFEIELFKLSEGFPKPMTDTIIPEDNVPGAPLYVPFADPSFGGSLFLTLYYMNAEKCNDFEVLNKLCESQRYVIPDSWKAGNYALNKFLAKLLTSNLVKDLIGSMLQ